MIVKQLPPTPTDFGRSIRYRRLNAGLSQSELGVLANLCPRSIQRIEANELKSIDTQSYAAIDCALVSYESQKMAQRKTRRPKSDDEKQA